MQTFLPIAEPFGKLLKKQNVKAGEQYRPMNFVVEQPVEDGLLLYHTMTKSFVLLTPEEAKQYKTAPSTMTDLIGEWFLVPMAHDDRLLSRQIRDVARMVGKHTKAITSYTIMTTTDCNARCFYCYEMGVPRIPMSLETAKRVADYIIKHSQGEKVHITWYGGEPLYNKPIITYISNILKESGTKYESFMITNGYLFDDETIDEANSLWQMKSLQISLDGTEQIYNRSKAFIYKGKNAYRRVIDNIHKLQEAGIRISIRLNIDMHNADNLMELAEELHREFPNPEGIGVYLHQLFEEEKKRTAIHHEEKRKIVFNKMQEIRLILANYGFARKVKLRQKVKTNKCMADNDSCITITPDGHIGKCDHYSQNNFVSHIDSDEWDEATIDEFRKTNEETEACETCFDYPNCFMLTRCQATHHCYPEMCEDSLLKIKQEMLMDYAKYKTKEFEADEV